VKPEERVRKARMAAHALHSKRDGRETTAAARKAWNVDHFEQLVDPDRKLPARERAKRAQHARKAHMINLADKSARSRKRGGGAARVESRSES
jgi:hypothetical protein